MASKLLDQFIDDKVVSEQLWKDTCEECGKNKRTRIEGHFDEGDLCLRKTYLKVGHERLKRVQRYVEHPTEGVKSTRTIHAILVYDHRSDGKDNGADIIEGGIDQKQIKIEMESKCARGMEFTVIIIGK